jgi:hypothetical protein
MEDLEWVDIVALPRLKILDLLQVFSVFLLLEYFYCHVRHVQLSSVLHSILEGSKDPEMVGAMGQKPR